MIRLLKENYDNNLYQQLLDFVDGKIHESEIQDNLIKEVKRGGNIIIEFSFDEYLNLFDDVLQSYDKSWIESAFSYYGHFDYFDWYRANDDWREGYLLRNVNGESEELLKKILRILAPNLIEKMFNDYDDEAWQTASKLLDDTFNREVENIITDYTNNMNENGNDWLKKEATNDLCEFFEDANITKMGHCFKKYVTNVKTLIKLYNEIDALDDDLESLLKKYVEKIGLNASYSEYVYEAEHEFFDDERFQTDLNTELQNMLEKMEDSDIFSDIEEYKKITNQISKFNFDTWEIIPKDRTMEFKVYGVNPETNLIKLAVRDKSSYREIKYEIDLEQLNLILYQPELFRKSYD